MTELDFDSDNTCPKCKQEDAMRFTENDEVTCEKCGTTYKMVPTYKYIGYYTEENLFIGFSEIENKDGE